MLLVSLNTTAFYFHSLLIHAHSYLLTFGSPIGVSGVSRGGARRIRICETRFPR